jgi:hypothetical protein
MTQRDRRALALLGVAAVGLAVYQWSESATPNFSSSATATPEAVLLAEKRLDRARRLMAVAPERDQIMKQVTGELSLREKGLVAADTPQQAQAQVLQIVRKLARNENMDIRTSEILQVRPLGDSYGEAQVAVGLECRIEQLLNLLAAITAQPELLSTYDLRVSALNPRDKTVSVRITVAAVVPKKLVPEKKATEL